MAVDQQTAIATYPQANVGKALDKGVGYATLP